ncbi:DUF2087 domain-containing protein [Alkalibacillus haloalkaliphilus]|uniref:Transcriptional regulator n=1 Tax=Alkalibacillus haloalkaliphilus TaxID=94136 RepID=A0A511W3D3_9BACI|nr:DUF2087 domain-containing protein [Alkalibacillus haloalkaliphilus]GEN45560.1 transcriptional regulator [Alkalibacillus haloalkaliphilus]
MTNNQFWNALVEELMKGYTYNQDYDTYTCLICEKTFENGVIYPIEDTLFEARKAAEKHIITEHGSMFQHLTSLDKKYTGLTELQQDILQHFKSGLSDKEIAKQIEAKNTSTIRHHRFKLKEKEKQARVFLAIMELLDKEQDDSNSFITIHKGATMVDERYAITQEEKEKVLKTYFDKGLDQPLKQFPSKEKRKIIILQQIATKFDRDQTYNEFEVNQVLKQIYDDHVTLRRYLIEYGFMERSRDGKEYNIK